MLPPTIQRIDMKFQFFPGHRHVTVTITGKEAIDPDPIRSAWMLCKARVIFPWSSMNLASFWSRWESIQNPRSREELMDLCELDRNRNPNLPGSSSRLTHWILGSLAPSSFLTYLQYVEPPYRKASAPRTSRSWLETTSSRCLMILFMELTLIIIHLSMLVKTVVAMWLATTSLAAQ